MSLTVHHLEASRSHRILWLLEEMAIPYVLQTYRRDPTSGLAPAELKQLHPLGKSPVITDGDWVIAESGAIIEYVVETYGDPVREVLPQLSPALGSIGHRQCRFWMHYAEGSLMNWLLMQRVFSTIPRQPMPFFVRPIAKAICQKVQAVLVAPNVQNAVSYMDSHLSQQAYFAGDQLSMADFQMSFAVEAALASDADAERWPHLRAYLTRIQSRPAYQRALNKGGPLLMTF